MLGFVFSRMGSVIDVLRCSFAYLYGYVYIYGLSMPILWKKQVEYFVFRKYV